MHKLGIRGVPHKLITSYLSDRTQSVVVNSVESDKSNISTGVPQGSCNGPLFYLIYANDLITVLQEAKVIFYADDTVISVTGDSLQDIEDKLNTILSKLLDWCNFNKITINIAKTKYMIITNKQYNPINITIDDK